MKKKAQMSNVFGFIMIFSFISIIYIFMAVLIYGITNDYILFNLQEVVDDLGNSSIISNNTVSFLQQTGDDYRNFNFHWDDIWFLSYIAFFMSSLIVSYRVRKQNYFTFLGMLFYGVMVILFAITIFTTLTNWFKDNIMIAVLPSVSILLPKFYYYLDHIGIFSSIQIGLCLLINIVDFDFAKIFQKKKQEQQALEDDEEVI